MAKLAGDGSGLLWATYLGGADVDVGLGIAVDAAGQVYVTGSTQSGRLSDGSGDFPTTPGAFLPSRPFGGCGHGGCSDGFIAKLSADGSTLVYGSYLGGGNVGHSYASAIAVDGAENAYVTGFFSAPSALTQYHFGAFAGYSTGAFVMKFGPAGALVYSADFGSRHGAMASRWTRPATPTSPGRRAPASRSFTPCSRARAGKARTPSWPRSRPTGRPSCTRPSWAAARTTTARGSSWTRPARRTSRAGPNRSTSRRRRAR